MREKARPNCMDYRALSLTVVSFTLDVPLLGCADKFRMSRGHRCSWGTTAIWDILRLSPNKLTASAAGKRILNPSHTRWCNFPRTNAVLLGVHSKAWGTFAMARSRDLYGQAGPVCTEMPFSTYSWSRGYPGCRTASGSAPRVLLLPEGKEGSQ